MDHDPRGFEDDSEWYAIAGAPEPLPAPEPARALRRVRTSGAGRALAYGVLAVLCFGFVFGPLALAFGQRARLAISEDPEIGGARAADAAIKLGKLGFAVHLAIVVTALPWILFVTPLMQGK